jgi:hypothetical protein
MDKVLTRKLFKDVYLKTLTKQVSNFNKGGLASLRIHHFSKGMTGSDDERVDYTKDDNSSLASDIVASLQGTTDQNKVQELMNNPDIYPLYSQGERTAMLLAPIASKLLTGTRMPGQSQAGAVASNVGAALPEVATTSLQMRKLENERLADIAKLSKTNATTSPLQKAIAGKEANFYADTMESVRNANNAFGDLDIIEKMAQNPNLTVGQFGPLSTRMATLAQGLGMKETGKALQDLPAEAILKNISGNIVMDSFGKFKGAISDADREFISSINPSEKMTKEQLLGVVEVKRRIAERNAQYGDLLQKWVADHPDLPSLSSKDPKTGKNFYDVSNEYLKNNPVFNKDLEKKLEDIKPRTTFTNEKILGGNKYYQDKQGNWYKIDKR